MDTRNLAGSLKVAILINSLNKDDSERLLRSIGASEREKVLRHLDKLGSVSPELAEKIAREFIEMGGMKRTPTARITGPSLSQKQRGDQPGDENCSTPSLIALRAMEPDQLYDLIKDELPQTIAVIIAHLEPKPAGAILSRLPDGIKTDVALRVANLDKVISGVVDEIEKVFEDVLKAQSSSVSHRTGGIDRLADILKETGGMTGEELLSEIEEKDPEMAARIRQKLFIFEDLLLVEDRGLQKVLRKVETRELAMALKGASEDVRGKIYMNMSERAKEMLMEEIEVLGPVRMREVEEAQQAITNVIQSMEAKGELIITGRKGDDLIV